MLPYAALVGGIAALFLLAAASSLWRASEGRGDVINAPRLRMALSACTIAFVLVAIAMLMASASLLDG